MDKITEFMGQHPRLLHMIKTIVVMIALVMGITLFAYIMMEAGAYILSAVVAALLVYSIWLLADVIVWNHWRD